MKRFAFLLVLAACSSRPPAAPATPPAPVSEAVAPVPVTPPAARGPSLYALDLALVDAQGASARLDRFRGHPTLVAMFYTSCPTACPMMIEAIRDVEKHLPAAARDDLRVLLVTFDPARDTPARLAAALAERHLDPARWTMAATDPDSVRTLAAALGVRYRNEAGGFVHSTTITLVDRDGRIAVKTDDLAQARATLAAAITGL